MKRKVIIRADGGISTGMGHVVRCLALADMLINDFEIVFAIQHTAESVLKTIQTVTQEIILLPHTTNFIQDALNFTKQISRDDIVVLDGYNFKTDYQKTIKAKDCKLICIDDLHAWHHVADAIINHAEGVDEFLYSAESYTKFYLGLNYVLLRKPFLKSKAVDKKISANKKIFISMGAADSNNITKKFTDAFLQINGIEEINLMLGSINPHLKSIDDLIEQNKHVSISKHFNITADELSELLQKCDVAICPASSISLECCAIGIGLISGYTAENQSGILSGLMKHKAAIDFGNMNQLSVEDIKIKMENVIKHDGIFDEILNNQKKMIDGKSPERLLNIFKQLSSGQLHFRFANKSDVDLYFNWANDSLVRQSSFNQNQVEYTDHVKWFQSKLKSGDCYFYLFLNVDDKPVGQVRIDKNKDETAIGISIDKLFRGKSFGVEMLKMACDDYFKKNAQVTIVAYIKKENSASYSTFVNAGFDNDEFVTEHGYESYKLFKKGNV